MAKNYQAIFFVLLILFLFLAVGCSKPFSGYRNNSQNTNESQSAVSNPQLEHEYEGSLKEILKPFWQQTQSSGLKEQILALSVPAKYLELHLDLVLAFDLIEQGQQEADQDKIEKGLTKINQLKDKYPWID